eukprot:TRINITY_DN12940_c0_g1_i1.p1 TRINITY_DN12940_c0_g1~~TRINITY_DN12940_c0_g1_i1.p1  ORF type:complete len:203 (-),score=23.18 TRINITY_DN12940_c0_g1_i1:49-657(-)
MANLAPQNKDEIKLKIGLVGESGVGKSCCLVRWVDDDFFEADDKYTIGVDFKYKLVTVSGKQVKLQIYDTAGQERFRTVTASFYRGAHGILLVYDITDAQSFHEKVTEWMREIRSYTPANTPVVFIGNKVDLAAKRAVDFDTAKQFAEKEGIIYMETSAKDGTNINEAFMTLAEKIVETKYPQRQTGLPEPLPKPSRRCVIL